MPASLPRYIRLRDRDRTIVEIRDWLTDEARAALAPVLQKVEVVDAGAASAQAEIPLATLLASTERSVVVMSRGLEMASVNTMPVECAERLRKQLGDGVRAADGVETVVAGVRWFFGTARRGDWSFAETLAQVAPREGIAIVADDDQALKRFVRRTHAEVTVSRDWDPWQAVVWPRADGQWVPDPIEAPVVFVIDGTIDSALRNAGVEAPNARVYSIEFAVPKRPGDADRTFVVEPPVFADLAKVDLRFVDPLVASASMAVVLSSGREPDRSIARALLARVADRERVTVLVQTDDLERSWDADVRIQIVNRLQLWNLGHVVRAMTALAGEQGALGFDLEDLVTIGRTPARVTSAGFAGGVGERASGRLVEEALDNLGWSRERLSAAVGFVCVVLGRQGFAMRELERMSELIAEAAGSDAHVLWQLCVGDGNETQVVILAFERESPSP